MKLIWTLVFSAMSALVTTGCSNNMALTDVESTEQNNQTSLVVASFNVSMDASNYTSQANATGRELLDRLSSGVHPQINNIAEIIQRVAPDIILLNEFDYGDDSQQRIRDFKTRYLAKSQSGQAAIDYPYHFVAPVNTGVAVHKNTTDNHGYGWFPGHYGMLVLSKYPIDTNHVRTFQKFLWKDMPNTLMSTIKRKDGNLWYNGEIAENLRLSSKSHWDIPVNVNGKTIHIFASHPTPPGFDGVENRNGKRNHDEIRFWYDYISDQDNDYIYDDKGAYGGFTGDRFMIMGDLNASEVEGSADQAMIAALLNHDKVNDDIVPQSDGGPMNRPNNPNSAYHTAHWAMRVDYAVPSRFGITVQDSGVFWPAPEMPLYPLVKTRKASSDHRLVWIKINVE